MWYWLACKLHDSRGPVEQLRLDSLRSQERLLEKEQFQLQWKTQLKGAWKQSEAWSYKVAGEAMDDVLALDALEILIYYCYQDQRTTSKDNGMPCVGLA